MSRGYSSTHTAGLLATALTALFISQAPAVHAGAVSYPAIRPLPVPSNRPMAAGPAYFADPVNGKDTNDGSIASPWKTLAYAVTKLNAGDTLYLREGVYYEYPVAITRTGTAAQPVTIRSYPGEMPIIDGSDREFQESPSTAWQPMAGSPGDEFITTKLYSMYTSPYGGSARGNFLDSMVPLESYATQEMMETANEFMPDSNITPYYSGPGVFFIWENASYYQGRIHCRLAHTTVEPVAAVGNDKYTGETDPRNLPLVVGGRMARNGDVIQMISVQGSQYVRLQDLVIRGGPNQPLYIGDSSNIELDGLTCYYGMSAARANGLYVHNCVFRGAQAPWHSRAHMKYEGGAPYLINLYVDAATRNLNVEFAYCEFTDGHDFYVGLVDGLKFHHNYVDNFNDDGMYLSGGTLDNMNMEIYQNYISHCYQAFSFAGGQVPGNGAHIYRNVLDGRHDIYTQPPGGPGQTIVSGIMTFCNDHGSPVWEPMWIYQNTLLGRTDAWRDYYGEQLGGRALEGATTRDMRNNIVWQYEGLPGFAFSYATNPVIRYVPPPNCTVDGNLMWGLTDGPSASPATFFPAGWSAIAPNDKLGDPLFMTVTGDWHDRPDARIQAGSAAIGSGAVLPADWPDPLRPSDGSAPDAGAFPLGSAPFRVGAYGNIIFPTANHAPGVTLAARVEVTMGAALALSGQVSDDGLPNPPAALSLSWNKISGPGNVAFADRLAASTTATFSAAGLYVLQLSASDGELTGADRIIVNVLPLNPPQPNPMTWAVAPNATSPSAITMTATTATHPNGVEYYFQFTGGGNTGGHDSGWQSGTTYTNTGLQGLTQYSYRVKARELGANHDETAYSAILSATTQDGRAPTPNPTTWAAVPAAAGPTSISMTATTATDPSGVEYYFACTAGGGHDSGWQDGTAYTDTGLQQMALYTYKVRARDKSVNHNTCSWSVTASATTLDGTAPTPNPMTWAVAPAAAGPASVSMTAATATDPSGVEYYFACTAGGGHDSGWQDATTYADTGIAELTQYTYQVKARDKSVNHNETAYSSALSATTQDGTPPTPNPMTWAVAPAAAGPTSISMTATTAADPSGVEYYFQCAAGGGHDSGWQDSPIYTDAGLQELTQYTYQVRARDKSPNRNAGGWSVTASATTLDGTAPTPNPMTWAVAPAAAGPTSISMTATTAADPSGVEYYFQCTAGGGHDSGWQDGATYTDVGLDELTQYTYQVKARDKSPNHNETAYSAALTAMTPDATPPTPNPLTWAAAPAAAGPTSISMTATTAADPSGVEYYFQCAASGGHDSGWQDSPAYTDTGLQQLTQYTYKVQARDKSPNRNTGGWSATASATTPDGAPPTPNPMTWAAAPNATSPTSITMAATTAADPSGVEYYFLCAAGGGHDSGWQPGTTYTDTGLVSLTQYAYRVKARDKSPNHNETAYSTALSATTLDGTPPAPNPMTWAVAPYALGSSSISMTAATATDPSGVEYYFQCTAGGGHSSAWQASATYVDSGLSGGVTYTYKVKARDKSAGLNETNFSAPASAKTQANYVLSVQSTPVTGISVTSTTGQGGMTNYSLGAATGASVNLSAPSADPTGYVFSQWRLNGTAQTKGRKALTLTMNAAATAIAEYTPVPCILNVQSTPVTGIRIGSTTGQNGTTNYSKQGLAYGKAVSLSAPATDPANYNFVQWRLNGTAQAPGQKTISFTMDVTMTAVAEYAPVTYLLSVQSTPVTGIAIASSTSTGGTTNYSLAVVGGASVYLRTPTTDPAGYVFAQWRLNGKAQKSGQKIVTFTMSAASTAVAEYRVAP